MTHKSGFVALAFILTAFSVSVLPVSTGKAECKKVTTPSCPPGWTEKGTWTSKEPEGGLMGDFGTSDRICCTTPSEPYATGTGEMLDNVDLFGSDYAKHGARDFRVCMNACNSDPRCRAWTFLKNGSMCFLKNALPTASVNKCCISGAKKASEASKPTRGFGRGTAPKNREECEAAGKTWIAEKGRCLGPAALSALRAVCEKKGPGHRYDLPTMQCVGPQGEPVGGETACSVLKPGTVYDGPSGNETGALEAGTDGVTLLGKQGNDWYNIKWPGGQGWVYSGPGYEDAIACP